MAGDSDILFFDNNPRGESKDRESVRSAGTNVLQTVPISRFVRRWMRAAGSERPLWNPNSERLSTALISLRSVNQWFTERSTSSFCLTTLETNPGPPVGGVVAPKILSRHDTDVSVFFLFISFYRINSTPTYDATVQAPGWRKTRKKLALSK